MRKGGSKSRERRSSGRIERVVDFDVDDEIFGSMDSRVPRSKAFGATATFGLRSDRQTGERGRLTQEADSQEAEFRIAKLLKSNSEMIQAIKAKEAQLNNNSRLIELTDQMSELHEALQLSEADIRKLARLNRSLEDDLEAMDAELQLLKDAEQDLEKRIELLADIVSRIQRVKSGVHICLNLKCLDIVLRKRILSRQKLLFESLSQASEEQIPHELGINILMAACLGKLSQAYRNLRLLDANRALKIVHAGDKLDAYLQDEKLKKKSCTKWHNIVNKIKIDRLTKNKKLEALFKVTKKALSYHLKELSLITKAKKRKNPLRLTQVLFKKAVSNMNLSTPRPSNARHPSLPTEDDFDPIGRMTLLPLNPVEISPDLSFIPFTPRTLSLSGPLLQAKAFHSLIFGVAGRLNSYIPDCRVASIIKLRHASRILKVLIRITNRSGRKLKQTSFSKFYTQYMESLRVDQETEERQADQDVDELRMGRKQNTTTYKMRMGVGIISKIVIRKLRSAAHEMYHFYIQKSLTRINKRQIGFESLENFFKDKKVINKKNAYTFLLKAAFKRLQPELSQLGKSLTGLNHENQTAQKRLGNSTRACQISKSNVSESILRGLVTNTLSWGFGSLKREAFIRKIQISGLTSISNLFKSNNLRKMGYGIKALTPRPKRIHLIIKSIQKSTDNMMVRASFFSVKELYLEKKNRSQKLLKRMGEILEKRKYEFQWSALFYTAFAKEKVHKSDLKGMVEHSKSIEDRTKDGKRFSAQLRAEMHEKDKAWLRIFLVRRDRLHASSSLYSLIKPMSPVKGIWLFNNLARAAAKVTHFRLKYALSCMYTSKMVLNVYDLQTKRDEAFNALSDIRKTLIEDYASFNSAFATYKIAKDHATASLALSDAVLEKLLPKISVQAKYPILKIMFRRFKRIVHAKKNRLRDWHLKRLRKYWQDFTHSTLGYQPNKKIEEENPSSPLMKKLRKKASFGNLSQASKVSVRKGAKKLTLVFKDIVTRSTKAILGRLREVGKERMLRNLAEQVVRVRREADKMTRQDSITEGLRKPGTNWVEIEPSERDLLTKSFRAWKVRTATHKQSEKRLDAFQHHKTWRTKVSCFRSLKTLRKPPTQTLKELKTTTYHPLTVEELKKSLTKTFCSKISLSHQGKVRACFKAMRVSNNLQTRSINSTIIHSLHSLVHKNTARWSSAALMRIKNHAQSLTTTRLAIAASKTRRQASLNKIFHSLPRPIQISDSSFSKIGLKKLPQPSELKTAELLLLRRAFICWKKVKKLQGYLRDRLKPIRVALRTWKFSVGTAKRFASLRTESRGPMPSTTIDQEELEEIKMEYKEIHDLTVQATRWEKRTESEIAKTKRNIRCNIGVVVEGSVLNLVKLLQKLATTNKRQAWQSVRRFAGGPGLVDAKQALAAMSRLLESLAQEKLAVERHGQKAAAEHRRRAEQKAVAGRLVSECAELEDRVAKVCRAAVDKRELARALRLKVKAAIAEKEKLVGLLQAMH